MKLPLPEKDKESATDDDRENLKAAHEREKAATTFYRKAKLKRRGEPRVKKVFTALSEIEADHIALEEKLKGR